MRASQSKSDILLCSPSPAASSGGARARRSAPREVVADVTSRPDVDDVPASEQAGSHLPGDVGLATREDIPPVVEKEGENGRVLRALRGQRTEFVEEARGGYGKDGDCADDADMSPLVVAPLHVAAWQEEAERCDE